MAIEKVEVTRLICDGCGVSKLTSEPNKEPGYRGDVTWMKIDGKKVVAGRWYAHARKCIGTAARKVLEDVINQTIEAADSRGASTAPVLPYPRPTGPDQYNA